MRVRFLTFMIGALPAIVAAGSLPFAEPDVRFLENQRGPGMDLSITAEFTNETQSRERVGICVRYFDLAGVQVDNSLSSMQRVSPAETLQLELLERRQGARFYQTLDHIHVSLVSDRRACAPNEPPDTELGFKKSLGADDYHTALREANIVEPFGDLVWGETPAQVVTRICNDLLFPGIDDRERFCSLDVGRATYTDFAEGRLDEFGVHVMETQLDFLANHHSRVTLYQEDTQLIASDPITVMVEPITLFGVPYELHLSFEGLDEFLARWHLEREAGAGEVSPYCFAFREKTFCEYPTVLTRVRLKTNDPRNVDVCDSIQGVIDDRYGAERPIIRAGTRLNMRRSDCYSFEYVSKRYLEELHYRPLRALQESQIVVADDDDASGL